jgi:hypothetical protein
MSGDQVFGGTFICLGLLSLITPLAHFAGLKVNAMFRKLEPMQRQWGEKLGTVIHFIGYVITPLILGILLLLNNRS